MLNRIRTKQANDEGFTLVEMLIVIVVLGILAGITVFGVAKFREDASASACSADLKTVQVAADAYFVKNNSFPDDIADLTGGTSPYLKTAPKGTFTFDTTAKTVTQATCTA